VNFAPLPLEMILRSNRRDAQLLLGYLLEGLLDAARKLWPEFVPLPKRKPLGTIRREFDPLGGFSEEDKMKPVWRRDRGQGLAEYALILVLIAIVAIVALVFLGNQISSIFNQIGQSI
jgi:pilus assembly protein Flp/PilA